jgi:hypothetical protein
MALRGPSGRAVRVTAPAPGDADLEDPGVTVVAAILGSVNAAQLGPGDELGYRRPPATVSFEDLRRRGLPEVLFVHSFLVEGVTICDVAVFAAMIEEGFHTPGILLVNPPGEDGRQLVRGFNGNGLWEWGVVTPGGRSGWRMMLAPERDGQRQVTVEARTIEDRREVIGRTLATFSINARPPGQAPAVSPVLVDPPAGIMKYRRPPATASFDDLSRRGRPRVLFVNHFVPEGITVCDIDAFAAMIEEAYHTDGTLRMLPDLDEHGNEQCLGIGSAGTWEWAVVRPSKAHNGDRYASAWQGIYRVLIAPEQDGTRACTAVLGPAGHEPEGDERVTFTISARPKPARGDAAGNPADPADTAAALGLTLTRLAGQVPGAAGLLRLLAFLAPEPVPLGLLLAGKPAVGLPAPQAAALIGPLLGDQAAASSAVTALRRNSLLSQAGGGREVVSPPARAAVRARLTTEEAAHWQRAAAAVVEAAVPADPAAPASWPACAALLPHARAILSLTSDGMGRIARYLGDSGSYPAARDRCRLIADACAADDDCGPEHPRTLAARRELARWTGMAGDAASARDDLAALLPVTERVQGPEHPDTLAVRRELARWTGEAGDAAGARDQCVGLWPVTERVLGGEHLDALAARRELARWTWVAGDEAGAGDRWATLLPVLEQVLGRDHSAVEMTRREFSDLTGLEKAKAGALYPVALVFRIYQWVLGGDIYERVLGADHPDTMAVWGTALSWTGEAGYAAYSRNHFQVLLHRRERILGPGHPDTLLTRHEFARFTGMAGDAVGARDQFADLLPATERVLGPDHPRTLATRSNLTFWTEKAQR